MVFRIEDNTEGYEVYEVCCNNCHTFLVTPGETFCPCPYCGMDTATGYEDSEE